MTTEQKSQRPFIAPGWYQDLSNAEYHGSFGTSSSQLKRLLTGTPAHLLYGMEHPTESTAAMALGTAVHTLVLEPDQWTRDIAVLPEINKRTNAGKAEFEAFQLANKGKTIITPEQFDQARQMADAVHNDPIASVLLQDTVRESSIYWWYDSRDPDDDTEYREMLKVRPDAICRAYPCLLDIKTTGDATYSEYTRDINKFFYHVSAAMYLEGVNQNAVLLAELKHLAYSKMVHICVENVEPYLVAVYELSPEYMAIGRELLQVALRRLNRAKAEDFPGFPEEIRIIEPPPWAHRAPIV